MQDPACMRRAPTAVLMTTSQSISPSSCLTLLSLAQAANLLLKTKALSNRIKAALKGQTGSDDEDNDDRGNEEDEDSGADTGDEDHNGDDDGGEDGSDVPEPGSDGENDNDSGADDSDGDAGGNGDGNGNRSLGPDMEVQPVVKKYEEDNNVRYLVHRCRVLMEGFLVVPDINQLAPEATIQEQSPRVATAVTSAFDKCINVLPIGDLSTLFQAHDATMELTNMDSAEVFTDIQNDSLISLGTSQAGYVAGDFGERSSLVAWEPILQQ